MVTLPPPVNPATNQRQLHQPAGTGDASPLVAADQASLAEHANTLAQHSLDILQGKSSLAKLSGRTPGDLEAIYARGFDAWHQGDIDAATSEFGYLVLLQPLDRRFHFAFACALQKQGQLSHALTFFGYAIALQANDPFTTFHIAECLLGLNEVDAARDALDATIALCYGRAVDDPCYGALRLQAEKLLVKVND